MPNYSPRFDPPAPILEISVENPSRPKLQQMITAILDTGADVSAIPKSLTRALNLESAGVVKMTGLDSSRLHPTHIVNLKIEGYLIERIEVIQWLGDEVILGRDALNEFEIFLDGKNRTFELRDP